MNDEQRPVHSARTCRQKGEISFEFLTGVDVRPSLDFVLTEQWPCSRSLALAARGAGSAELVPSCGSAGRHISYWTSLHVHWPGRLPVELIRNGRGVWGRAKRGLMTSSRWPVAFSRLATAGK